MNIFSKIAAAAILTAISTPLLAEDVDLDAMRSMTEKYKDVEVALADGYIPDPSGMCVDAGMEGLPPEWGGMGIHYIHPARLKLAPPAGRVDGGSTHTDFMAPAILLYEPQADGSMELVGVENLVFEAAWKAAGNMEPPMLNGRMWDHMADDPATDADEAHGFMPHYDQHVWLFRENPAGDLMPFNPNVTCEHAMMTH
ncbi:hypothetical protein [Celeribacter litoreus]|uniref:hypothetical protein n=1 Tax=Celeribacter litoreus TaxID=2876714 RepID=UPI001CCB69D5|nr:hypothetical protein [Celeribacter litoreus]MCA0044682.1 hypothetical protein [Celeribacter litoreus]